MQPTWTRGKVLAALDSPGLQKALRSMMTTSKRFWHLSSRNAQTLERKHTKLRRKHTKLDISQGLNLPHFVKLEILNYLTFVHLESIPFLEYTHTRENALENQNLIEIGKSFHQV